MHNWVKVFEKFNEYGVEPVKIDIKKCIKYISLTWNNVTNTTIENCWCKADIIPTYDERSDNENKILMELARLKKLKEVQVLID